MKACPFPQANNMDLIYSIFFDIDQDGITKYDIVRKYHLAERQGQYYLDALLFIGLVEKYNLRFFLNAAGVKLRMTGQDQQKEQFCKIVLEHPFLKPTYSAAMQISDRSARLEFIATKIFNEYNLCSNTAHRRASSMIAWFDWLTSNS